MAVNLTVAAAIETNKISSEIAYVFFLEIDVVDSTGAHVEYVRLCDNDQDLSFEGNVYMASSFDISASSEANSLPKVTISSFDPLGVIRQKMEQYNGGVGFNVRVMVVDTSRLTDPAEIDEIFQVVSASADGGSNIHFDLGAENPLTRVFPRHRQYRDRCPYQYKGNRCQYAGGLPSCDYTLNGSNGCQVHNNVVHFGGFPGLNNRNV